PATRARGQGHRARPGQGVPQSWPLLGQEDTCSLTGRLIHQRVTEGGAIDKRPSEQGCSAREGHQRREGAAADRLARTQRGGPTARSQALSTNSLKEISMYEVKRHSCLYLGLELAVAASLAAAPTTSAGPIRIERTFANNSLLPATDFHMAANPNTNMIYEAKGQSTPRIIPRTTYFPATSFGVAGGNSFYLGFKPHRVAN